MPKPRNSGFALIIILLVLALMSAVAVTSFTSAEGMAISQTRVEQESQARGIAERCSGLVNAYRMTCRSRQDSRT